MKLEDVTTTTRINREATLRVTVPKEEVAKLRAKNLLTIKPGPILVECWVTLIPDELDDDSNSIFM